MSLLLTSRIPPALTASSNWLLSCALVCLATFLPSSARADNDLLPQNRTYTELRPGERNPFGQQVSPAMPMSMEAAETEESRLRRFFGSVKIGGVARSGNKCQILLGSLILKEGQIVPQLFAKQEERIRVASITPKELRLVFVEKEPTADSVREIIIPYGFTPKVSQLLYGEAAQKLGVVNADGKQSDKKVPFKGVEDFLKSSQESDLQNMVDQEFDLMGEVKDAKTREKKLE